MARKHGKLTEEERRKYDNWPRLRKWDQLNHIAKRQVKATFVHWHHDRRYNSQEAWARDHAFWINVNGSLNAQRKSCEPAWMADSQAKEN